MSKEVRVSCATLPRPGDSFVKMTHFEISFFHYLTDQGKTPLHVAAHNNHFDVCSLLLERGASVHAQTDQGHTPLHMALMGSGNQRLVAKLIEKGPSLNFTFKITNTSEIHNQQIIEYQYYKSFFPLSFKLSIHSFLIIIIIIIIIRSECDGKRFNEQNFSSLCSNI